MLKRLSVWVLLAAMLTVCACGGGSDEKSTSETSAKPEKKLSLKTKEGMMMQLDKFGITIPDSLQFVNIERKSSGYRAMFEAKEIGDSVRAGLDKWHADLVARLTAEGWKRTIVEENSEMFGSVINRNIFLKKKGGGSTLSYGVDMSTVFDTKKKSYTLYISPGDV